MLATFCWDDNQWAYTNAVVDFQDCSIQSIRPTLHDPRDWASWWTTTSLSTCGLESSLHHVFQMAIAYAETLNPNIFELRLTPMTAHQGCPYQFHHDFHITLTTFPQSRISIGIAGSRLPQTGYLRWRSNDCFQRGEFPDSEAKIRSFRASLHLYQRWSTREWLNSKEQTL